jgi:hypothetical protein
MESVSSIGSIHDLPRSASVTIAEVCGIAASASIVTVVLRFGRWHADENRRSRLERKYDGKLVLRYRVVLRGSRFRLTVSGTSVTSS